MRESTVASFFAFFHALSNSSAVLTPTVTPWAPPEFVGLITIGFGSIEKKALATSPSFREKSLPGGKGREAKLSIFFVRCLRWQIFSLVKVCRIPFQPFI